MNTLKHSLKQFLINTALNTDNDSSKKERIMLLWEKEIISPNEAESLIQTNNLIYS